MKTVIKTAVELRPDDLYVLHVNTFGEDRLLIRTVVEVGEPWNNAYGTYLHVRVKDAFDGTRTLEMSVNDRLVVLV